MSDSTDTKLPSHEAAQTIMLHRIVKLLERDRPGDFALEVIVNAAGTPQRIGGTNSPGVIHCVHNPTAAPLTLTLTDGVSGAPPLFSAQLAAGESRHLYVPFTAELVASAGTGARVFGRYRS